MNHNYYLTVCFKNEVVLVSGVQQLSSHLKETTDTTNLRTMSPTIYLTDYPS